MRDMTAGSALQGMIVTELGGREAVGICGSLLAQLGATVVLVEPSGAARERDAHRAPFAAGKLSLSYDGGERDRELLGDLMARSDVVLTSSDVDAANLQLGAPHLDAIVCDVTAFGGAGPRAGEPASELQLQALSGIMHTSGQSDGPPAPIFIPVIGYSAAIYAAAAVLAALRVRRLQGLSQRVEVAMYDAAIVSLNVYLAGVLTGQVGDRTRMGARHPTIAPWNQYKTADGWVLICAGSQSQWEKLRDEMGRPDIAARFKTQTARVQGVEQLDEAIESWTRTLSASECVERLGAAGVACGPIAPIDLFPREANLDYRAMIRKLRDPVSGDDVFAPASPLSLRETPPVQPDRIPAPGADRVTIKRLIDERIPRQPIAAPLGKLARPLAGVRVVEVGQYTTAPLCARHLAHLGADVIKIEKPGGDESRTYGPFMSGRSEINWMNNVDKRGLVLDLLSPTGKDKLTALLKTADVFIENNKPGTLARFGFSREALATINPKLVYCAISGFGADSLYASRPGFDTVIQAMSGFMTAANPGGAPLKSGISTSDLMGAETGIVAILAALENRERTGRGEFIDLSMQDVSCWLTATAWNGNATAARRSVVVPCADGYVLAETDEAGLAEALRCLALTAEALVGKTRDEVAARLAEVDLAVAPVNSVREAAQMPQAVARRVWFTMPDGGHDWPTLASPLRLHLTPAEITRPAPGLDQHGEEILREIGYSAQSAAGRGPEGADA
jgi:crotonobetainyl-CoA:carnitine CoA-transferase CaiB-like acyl-CoA transferase